VVRGGVGSGARGGPGGVACALRVARMTGQEEVAVCRGHRAWARHSQPDGLRWRSTHSGSPAAQTATFRSQGAGSTRCQAAGPAKCAQHTALSGCCSVARLGAHLVHGASPHTPAHHMPTPMHTPAPTGPRWPHCCRTCSTGAACWHCPPCS